MLLPSKVTPYSQSILSKFPIFLGQLGKCNMSVIDLFEAVKKEVADVGEFIEVIDCLFALNKIALTETQDLYIIKAEEDV